jgi:hypothetical protein
MSIPKLNAIEVEFSDGSKIVIHEPKGREGLKAFLSALPALSVLQRVFSQLQDIQNGVMDFSVVDIPDAVIESIYRLFGVMAEITAEDFEGLSVTNQMALLRGFSLFAPKNPTSAVTPSPTPVVSETTSLPTPLTS